VNSAALRELCGELFLPHPSSPNTSASYSF
jgi:hypothetical protein